MSAAVEPTQPTDEWVRLAAEAMEDAAMRLIGRDLGTVHRDEIARAALAAAYPVMVKQAIADGLRAAAKDVHMWAHAMTTQQAATAATFAADRILELAGIDGDEADEVAREAHAEWLARAGGGDHAID